MENRRVSSITLLLMVFCGLRLSRQVESSEPSFVNCYESEFLSCVTNTTILNCAFKSLEQCVLRQVVGGIMESSSHYDCKAQCAKAKCTHLSTRRDPGARKVERCVDSCSSQCVEA